MTIPIQASFLAEVECMPEAEDWTFQSASTRELTHVYHDYPARMIPQVAGKLIDRFGKGAPYVFDPYCGSGTSLVEANLRGINAIGTDLNPLARLIAKSKTATPELAPLEKQLALFNKMLLEEKLRSIKDTKQLYGLSRLEFWFKPAVIQKLLHLREYIRNIEDEDIRLFFQVAFSETVRESSNTRKDEFKLYRYAEDKLTKFNPDVFTIMVSKLHRNIDGYKKYRAVLEKLACIPSAAIHSFNTVEGIPEEYISPESIALVVTSPPYGDSSTTVAYGQYSRLSAAWLELEEPGKIDGKLMGGKINKEGIPSFPSERLQDAIKAIEQVDEKRAREVASFYVDLYASISHVAKVIKRKGYACYVVGNRKVKGNVLPTDIAVQNFFEDNAFEHTHTYIRSIPNKRMPLRNSPTNISGVLDDTMNQEYIVVMQRS